MKVNVDSTRCQGHNRCMIFAPEVFEVDEFGFATVQEGADLSSPEVAERVRTAEGSCPEMAIVVTDD